MPVQQSGSTRLHHGTFVQGLEPKKAPPPDLLRRLFGYPDPEAASTSGGADALQHTAGGRQGGAQFAEPVPGDFAYSGEEPPLAGRSTKPPTPRRVNAVNRGAVRAGGGSMQGSPQISPASSSFGGEEQQPRVAGDQRRDSVEGSGMSASTEEQDAGDPRSGRVAAQRGEYDIITGRYAEPQPGDFGYEAPQLERHAFPAGRVSVRDNRARRRGRDSGKAGGIGDRTLAVPVQ